MEQQIKRIEVDYLDAEHKYFVKGTKERIISVTQFIGSKYDGVPENVLKLAAERGTLIHNEIEAWELYKANGITDELYNYITLKQNNEDLQCTPVCERIVAGNFFNKLNIAGRFDLFYQTSGVLADIKTTVKLDKKALQIQLSLLAYMLKADCYIVTSLIGIWLRPDKTEIVEVDLLPLNELEALIDKYLAGDKVELMSNEIIPFETDKITKMLLIEEQMKTMQEQYDNYKSELFSIMQEKNISSAKLESDYGKLTLSLTAPTIRTSIDSDKLKKEMPDVFQEYSKISNVKGSLRIKSEFYNRQLAS